jgi:hypothetical protein
MFYQLLNIINWNIFIRRHAMAKEMPEPTTEVIAETDNFLAWTADEPDGEKTFHLELSNITVHFFKEEWDEFLELVKLLS